MGPQCTGRGAKVPKRWSRKPTIISPEFSHPADHSRLSQQGSRLPAALQAVVPDLATVLASFLASAV